MLSIANRPSFLAEVDHTPKAHPASPNHSLPNTFATYRKQAQQHGPLNAGGIGMKSGASLGSIAPKKGEYFAKSELPPQFAKQLPWTKAEIEAIESGGASMFA
jgi:small subunit ribosomal protein YMR-31